MGKPLLAFALVAFAGALALAGKPSGGGGTGGGTVYYSYQGGTWSMNADGTGKTALPAGVGGEPSIALHGGQRWFAQVRDIPGETYPDGGKRKEIFAVRADGALVRQLTTGPDLQVLDPVRWKPGDAGISWVARRWSGGAVVEGGIYAADVLFDAAGNVTGLMAQPAAPAVVAGLDSSLTPDVKGHDWSPDGSQVAHERWNSSNSYEIRISDLSGSSRRLVAGGSQPRWSPDGSKIVYTNVGICTISPDGSGAKTVIKNTSGLHYHTPVWSPSASHLACGSTVYTSSGEGGALVRPIPSDIRRATAAGGSLTKLTSDLQQGPRYRKVLLGWR